MSAATFGAHAQVTVDGVLNTAELTSGNYVLVGKYTNPRGFGDAGLLSLYAASTATKVYFFVGGTVEPNGNSFQLFLDLPATTGVPVGTSLPAGAAGTSFEKMVAKMDLPVDLALALRSDGTGYKIEGATYTATAVTSKNLTGTTPIAGDGTASMLATDVAFPMLATARVAYKNATGGKLSANPGAIPANTTTDYGGAGTYGWEIELDRAAIGALATSTLQVFVLQNNGDGGFLSSDYIPQATTTPTGNGNLGDAPTVNFANVPGRQAATLSLTATGTVLPTKAANEASVAIGVFPNPASGSTTVSYRVETATAPVRIELNDLLGRTVRVVESGVKGAGAQSKRFDTADLAAGTYLVRVQVGEKVAVSKVVLR
ncbi:hypothetical protein AUC43_15890 [Hymenobacter sedentarius]|uniref:Secretion system C-terminal sorting domain-containing protein n=2 Tax=Hymenobacter sedentarius TaxID=1411621 RepID=A0A0U3SJX5_9BACT|nr:hypothetical protein AUC43_15890 [Hymenobacter sedentarius]